MSEIYSNKWHAYLLLLPTLAVSIAFLYVPALDTFRLSLYKTVAAGAYKTYVGLENFSYLISNARYHHSLLISFLFAVIVVVGTLVIALYLGFLIYRVALGQSGYLVTAILSYSFSFAVVALIMLFLLNPTVGIVTNALETTTGFTFDWKNDGTLAFAVVSGTTVFKMVGYNVLFVIGSLSSIPESINETARLDGIGNLKLLSRVYIPLISPTIAFLIIMNTVYAFFLPFPVIDLMTKGGPGDATVLLIYQLYQTAFGYSQAGLAAAQSIILFVIVGGLMLLQLWLSDKYSYYGGA